MDTFVIVLLSVLWFGIVIAAIYFIALRYTREPRNAAGLAGAAAIVFLLGSILHPTTRLDRTPPPPSSSAAVVANPRSAQPARMPVDVRLAALTDRGATATAAIDFVGFLTSGSPKPQGSQGNVFPLGSTIVLTGWAVDGKARTTAGSVFLIVDGTGRFRDPAVVYGAPRSDVARNYHIGAYTRSGYKTTIPTDVIGTGHHTLQLAVVAADKRGYAVFPARIEIVVQ